jgi:hypothetical protein
VKLLLAENNLVNLKNWCKFSSRNKAKLYNRSHLQLDLPVCKIWLCQFSISLCSVNPMASAFVGVGTWHLLATYFDAT